MKKEMLMNVLQPEESRIAIVEDGNCTGRAQTAHIECACITRGVELQGSRTSLGNGGDRADASDRSEQRNGEVWIGNRGRDGSRTGESEGAVQREGGSGGSS